MLVKGKLDAPGWAYVEEIERVRRSGRSGRAWKGVEVPWVDTAGDGQSESAVEEMETKHDGYIGLDVDSDMSED